MIALLGFLLALLVSPFRSKSRFEAENAALRLNLGVAAQCDDLAAVLAVLRTRLPRYLSMGFANFLASSKSQACRSAFFQSKAARNNIPMRRLMPLRRAASDPLDLSDEPNQERDADVTLPAFVGVPLSFGL